ncbi:MAG: 17 kDa surface antigen [Candidatus Gallionella acididurans]|uniref:17 kDa surface antigen n=1 Tax=Candidatus Gallionella acididurans TaxID=1796491 RepID=A0A139BXB2_9PROT|nr:MAG: 17 kDa surface antigen [Candidatus Gallionella acididurans]
MECSIRSINPQKLNHCPIVWSQSGLKYISTFLFHRKETALKTQLHKLLAYTATILVVATALTVMTGCSQKPSAEESAAQTQAIVDKAVAEAKQQILADQAAEKARQDAAAAAQAEENAKAKTEHEAAIAAAKKELLAEQRAAAKKPRSAEQQAAANGAYPPPPPPPGYRTVCANCGVVTSINAVESEGQGSGLGAIAGGLAGGLLGNQVGNGTGRDLTTIAGAVGGAFAGNKIEKTAKKTTGYDIVIRMDTGTQHTVHQNTVPGLAIGQRVKIENGVAVAN